MAIPLRVLVTRYFCNFNAIALALLALQNAGYLVLMGYAQQLQDTPPPAGEPPRQRLVSSHFLAVTEFTKLVMSFFWCMYDVLQDMRKDEQASLLEAVAEEMPDTAADKKVDAEVDTTAPSSAENSLAKSNPAGAMSPTAAAARALPQAEVAVSQIMARPNFNAQFATRLRHAVGFDEKYKEAMLMVVPAVLYTIQGLLLILALQYLDPTVFQILYQVRIMFLAVMMRVVLDFRLSLVRWVALVGLMVGIILAQLAMQQAEQAKQASGGANASSHKSWTVEGMLAALAGALLSSFSGVFMEFVFKKRGNFFTLSARNIHLAFFSLVYFWLVFVRDIWKGENDLSLMENVSEFFITFFDGFTGLVWFLVVLQAVGGILVALVMRYCDNIVKSFSTAFAIVLSGTASVFLFNLPLSPIFLLGSVLVMSSITVYSLKK